MKVDYIRGRSEHEARDLLVCRNAYVAPHSEMRALRGYEASRPRGGGRGLLQTCHFAILRGGRC
jgi:hypothetical protein